MLCPWPWNEMDERFHFPKESSGDNRIALDTSIRYSIKVNGACFPSKSFFNQLSRTIWKLVKEILSWMLRERRENQDRRDPSTM